MELVAPRLTKAEENCLTITGLVKKIEYDFLELGGLLLENQEYGYWGVSGTESFKDFIQQLGIGYSWATRLMGLVKMTVNRYLTKEEIVEMGVAKACLLLPHAKNGEIPEKIKLLARDCSFNDLRRELGHNLVEPKDCGEYLICPRCGTDITILQGMIKRR